MALRTAGNLSPSLSTSWPSLTKGSGRRDGDGIGGGGGDGGGDRDRDGVMVWE